MTQKELSYFEDAVGHEKNIIKIINESLINLQDEQLKTFMQNELNIHTQMKEELINLLEEKVNE